MAALDDWFFDYQNEYFYHIDGRISYGSNTGTAPSFGDYVIGGTSDAVGKVVAGSDLGGTNATGTLDLTEVRGVWQSGESIRVLSTVAFDTVGGTPQGFKVGDTLTGPTTESIDCQAIEYNLGATSGEGIIYGDNLTTGFANNEQIDVSGGATAVALVATDAETDNSGLFSTAATTSALTVPGTNNDSLIVHYDAGTVPIPVGSQVAETGGAGADGIVAEVYGDTTTGSLRILNSQGVWTDNIALDLELVVNWDQPTAGQVFQVGDVVQGSVSGATARIVGLIDDGDSTGALITADSSGTWDAATPDLIQVVRRGGLPITATTVAEVENTTHTRQAAVLNLPSGVFDFQRADQGGIYNSSEGSINIVRPSNEFYTLLQDTFDELEQLDDDFPVRGDVRDQVYVFQGGWNFGGNRSARYLNRGSWADETSDNVWSNDQSIMAAKNIGTWGFFYDATNPTPQPDLYCVQDSVVLDQFWLEGEIDVLILTRTNRDVERIDTGVAGLGQDIDGGFRTWNLRPYLSSYDYFTAATIGGVSTIPLNNANDGNNSTGTHEYTYNSGTGAFTVGETIDGGTSGARGIVVSSGTGATGTLVYVLKTAANFQDSETVTGAISGETASLDVAGGDTVVAGYGTNVRAMVVSSRMTGGTTSGGPFIAGEELSQGTNVGYFIAEEPAGTLYIEEVSGTWDGTTAITGDTSSASYTPTTRTLDTDFPYDIGDGLGDAQYSGFVSGNRTGAAAQTANVGYEWHKYITSREATSTVFEFQTRGVGDGGSSIEGRQFLQLFGAAGLNKSSGGPMASKPGDVIIGAVGWVWAKDTFATADIRNFRLFDNTNTQHDAPNLQNIQWSGLVSGDRVAIYRATGAAGGGSTTILRGEFQVGPVSGSRNAAADSIIRVQAGGARTVSPLPSDVPDDGIVYVEDPSNAGVFLAFPYTAVDRTNNDFPLTSGTIGAVTGGVNLTQTDDVHVCFVRESASGATASNQLQYVSDFPAVFVWRLKGYKPQRTASDFISTGANVGAARDPDPVVNLP